MKLNKKERLLLEQPTAVINNEWTERSHESNFVNAEWTNLMKWNEAKKEESGNETEAEIKTINCFDLRHSDWMRNQLGWLNDYWKQNN